MTKILISNCTIVLLLILSFHIANITAIECDKYNISHFQQNDTITIHFLSNHLLKLNRKVQCTSNVSIEEINGCAHYCNGLGYGQRGEIFIEMHHDNGTMETCFIKYTIPLQAPTLAFFNVPGDKVRLGIARPVGSFDYVNVQCTDDQSYKIFNSNTSLSSSIVTVDCALVANMPLMSFVLETVKKDFDSAINHINREVPLPVPFNFILDSLFLTVKADAPPVINLHSTYEFQLIFYDKNNESITYEQGKVSGIQPNESRIFNYSLIPNVKYRIIFTHVVNSTIYTRSNSTISPISNISYPYEVTNLRLWEEFQNIDLTWNDPHSSYDPIEFIVLCNSSETSMRHVNRNTKYFCQQTTFNEANIISVETRVAIPGYKHDRKAVVQIRGEQIPQIPTFEVSNRTETSITIRWNYNNNSLITNSFEYRIKCSLNHNSTRIDIRSNEYQCQSLDGGTLYIITMLVVNINNTIERKQSIQANTLLQKCQYKNHFYSSELNGTRSVIIEWSPPDKTYEKIYVQCPSGLTTYEYCQAMSFMYVKCIVTSGLQFNVTFSTFKSGYELATFQFTDTPPVDPTTTTTLTTTTSVSPSTTTTTSGSLPPAATTTTASGSSLPAATTTAASGSSPPATATTTSGSFPPAGTTTASGSFPPAGTTTTASGSSPPAATTTSRSPLATTTSRSPPATTTSRSPLATTTSRSPPATTTSRSPLATTTRSLSPSTTTSKAQSTTSISPETETLTTVASDCSQDSFSKTRADLTRWRTAAIIAFIVAGFLALCTICLIIFSILLYLRNRYNNTDK